MIAFAALLLAVLGAQQGADAGIQRSPGSTGGAVQPGSPASAVQPAAPLVARADGVVALLNGDGDYSAAFAPAFVAQVPKTAFDGIAEQLRAAMGRAVRVTELVPVTPWSARMRIGYERGTVSAQIAVDPNVPHRITGLRLSGSEAAEASFEAVAAALAALPGRTNFSVAALDPQGPRMLAGREAATPMGVGSTFKLVILAELVRATNAGERRWSDPVTLTGRPLPGGRYTQRPAGSTVPLRELAEAMISVSDNSATDILLAYLGRTKVEAMLPVVGWHDGAGATQPFLGTLEAFKIKANPDLTRRWAAADPVGRRNMLAGEVAAIPLSAIPPTLFQDGRPLAIGEVEWFASADDLVRTADWLRRNTEGPTGREARAILSKNPGIASAAAGHAWVGYKGGSEPGVINMTFLLQRRDGGWRAVTAGWNNPDAAVDQNRFFALVARAVALAGE